MSTSWGGLGLASVFVNALSGKGYILSEKERKSLILVRIWDKSYDMHSLYNVPIVLIYHSITFNNFFTDLFDNFLLSWSYDLYNSPIIFWNSIFQKDFLLVYNKNRNCWVCQKELYVNKYKEYYIKIWQTIKCHYRYHGLVRWLSVVPA